MEERSKQECKKKLRNVAACIIQFWYRYQLASRKNKEMTEYFRLVCFKLFVIANRMKRNRQLMEKLCEKARRYKRMRHLAIIIESRKQLGVNIGQKMMESSNIYRSSIYERRGSNDTITSSSFDFPDIDSHIDARNMYDDDELNSIDISDVEEWKLYKYKPLLRFFYFLLFRQYTRKFQRLLKADRLLEIVTEIREQEDVRHKHFRELELRINAMIGKPSASALSGNAGERLSITRRLDLCETKMTDMELTMKRIRQLVMDLQ
ncbi:hypothetical protein KIN20_008379 [Parelaphostrongylus tenuis]|nr:hypothetical protein KIN20_008379 [Parelaphostrongylus tenuis]